MSVSGECPAVPAHRVVRPGVSLGLVVAIACLAQFMVVLDTSIVNVALPAMHRSLHLSADAQQWVVDGYLVTFGGLLLLSARAGDLFGRKRVFQAGLVIFTLASLVGGLATHGEMLVVARIVQGIGASALAPSSLSLITASHSDDQRARALAIWGAAASSAGAVGMVLGGLLTTELSWRYVLFVNVPIGVVLLAGATAYLAPSQRGVQRPRLDLPGALTATVGVGLLVFGLSDAASEGWRSGAVVASLVAAAVLLAGFAAIESRTRQPLVRLGIFAERGLRGANLLGLFFGVIMTSMIYFLSLYLQNIVGYSALRAGLSLVPMGVALIVGSFGAQRMIPIFGTRRVAVFGSMVAGGGLIWMARIGVQRGYLVHVLGPTLVLGIGMSLILLAGTICATAGVAVQEAGLAAGLINMGRQIGGAIGLVVLATIATSVARQTKALSPPAAVVHGYHVAFAIDAAIAFVAAVASTFLPSIGRKPATTPDAPRPVLAAPMGSAR